MNKKLIILGSILVLALFVISACQGPVGSSLGTINRNFVYIDPTKCPLLISSNSDTFSCNPTNQFVGKIANIDCPNYYSDHRIFIGASWYENNLPYEERYTCADSQGNFAPPSQILGYCCYIQGEVRTNEESLNMISTDSNGVTTKNNNVE